MPEANQPSAADPAVERYYRDPAAMSVPWVESPFFERLLANRALAPRERELAQHYHEHGYVILEGVVDPDLVQRVEGEYARLFDPDEPFAGLPKWRRESLRRDPTRKQDAWQVSRPVRELACYAPILDVLRMLYGREPIPFQTLNFLPGTQQSLHSDAMHFSSIPARYMCGVWVALEGATPDNGPLMYVPGSHRFSETQLEDLGLWAEEPGEQLGKQYAQYESYLRALIRQHDLPIRELVIPRGTALVWAANLIHGGAPIRQPGLTRRSQVTHYYFEGCVYYTPVYPNPLLGELHLREVYDIAKDRRVGHSLNGEELRATALGQGLYRLGR
jgi:ectoine hydroxylase-related dioxygenase (phytanoyl-CoA dioxygenase family)